ncbi:1-propanol dehydrogenase PduQ [Sinanaerobacter chloroacetimidivorans]|uniref:Iron-containing alcohol dehydrogenase n=1 Tax=Sinanaerobacter chloroacetimidivorans TaxID=2818044 RepID=A0A8J7VYD9_9FIRM|nr:1-propanol dehydrogenase PduQ [Sinanaerobacter chloroacetimidivorans]MBR0597392.1 iron-containing alcohol dehydrogenase [Sinanaerobacter chloroacetimidivorans]
MIKIIPHSGVEWEVRIIEDKFRLKSKVYFNNQSLQLLKQITGSRAFIVSDSIMDKLGYLQKSIDYLSEAGISSVVFSEVKPDPDVKVVANGMKMYQESGADVLIALGGGSAIDTAKGILYFAWKLECEAGREVKRPLFIAIPSTSGTGSEVTDFSVITSEEGKVCIVDEFISPDIAILDSTCIQHVPQRVVADTGIDVLVHAIEAYVSTKATDFTDALAEKAIKLIFENLETIYKDVKDSDARDRVQNASCMAGMAFTNANLGINHSLAHALGGTFHIPHGRSNAILLNGVMEYNAELRGSASGYAAERYAKLAAVLQLPARTSREGAANFIQAVARLKKVLGIEDNIRSLGVDQAAFEGALEQMAEAAMADRCTPTNPRQPSKEDLICIYQKCY